MYVAMKAELLEGVMARVQDTKNELNRAGVLDGKEKAVKFAEAAYSALVMLHQNQAANNELLQESIVRIRELENRSGIRHEVEING